MATKTATATRAPKPPVLTPLPPTLPTPPVTLEREYLTPKEALKLISRALSVSNDSEALVSAFREIVDAAGLPAAPADVD